MKFYKFLRIAASVLLASVVLITCADDSNSNSNGDGGGTKTPSAPQVNNKCSTGGSGMAVNLFFGDATYTNCTTTAIATDGYFSFAANASEINHTVEASGGADSTASVYRLALTGGTSAWGGGGITLGASKNATFDATSKSLSLWLKSAQATTVNVAFEGVGVGTAAGVKSAERTISGITSAWKQFNIPIGDFNLQTLAANAINKIIFVFNDVNGATTGIGAQTIDIDEVRFVADGGTPTPISDVFVVYGDADYSALGSVNNVTLTTSFAKDADGGAGNITDVEVGAAGAKSRDVGVTVAGTVWAVTLADLAVTSDLSSYNTLKIDFKSPASGGVGKIGLKIEGVIADDHTTPVEKAFANDGTWQTVSWTFANLVKNNAFDFDLVDKVVLILSDANGATTGIGAQTFSWDEVRFETVNTPPDNTAPTVSNARVIATTARTANVSIDVNEAGKLFWVVYTTGTAAPANAAALIAAASAAPTGTTIANSSIAGQAIIAGTAMVAVPGLTAMTGYDFYAVAQDAASNNSALSAKLTITTAAPAAASDVFVAYGDADYSALGSVTNVTSSNTYEKNADGGADRITDVEVSSGGANSSVKSRDTNLTVAAAGWAVVLPNLASVADLSTYNTLKIAFKSPATGGVGAIKVKIEGDTGGGATNEEEKTFVNDGTWKTVSWAFGDFAKNAGFEFNAVKKVVLVLSDANGGTAGIGVQAFSWDEVRFETVVDITAPTVSNARVVAATKTSVNLTIDVNEAGKLFWVAYTDGTAAPANAAALIAAAGATPTGTTIANSGSAGQAITAGMPMVAVSGLTAGTSYDFYAVAQDAVGLNSALSAKLDISAMAVSKVFVVYGDADYSALGSVNNVTSTTGFAKDADGGAGNITDVEVGAAGAKSRNVGVTAAGTGWAVTLVDLAVTSDLSGYNTLKIDFKSPTTATGGVGKIGLKIEGVSADKHTTPVEKTFTNDGTWQTVSWTLADLVKNNAFDFDLVDKVVLILSDANGATAGIGAQVFSWDEVRFE